MSALIKSIGQNPCKFVTGPGGGKFLYPALLFGADMARVKSSEIILRYFIIGRPYALLVSIFYYTSTSSSCVLICCVVLFYHTPQERANELDEKITKINQSINELEEKKKTVVEEYDAKITAAKERIKSLEAKKQEILAPKAPRKPRKTKKQKIQEIVKLAMKNGMSVEEIAGQLHVEVES